MKSYTGKTVEEALQNAASETGVAVDDLIYIVSDKRKGLFSKKIVVEVYDLSDVIKYAEDLKDYAVEKAKSGHKWKGLKLVPSKVSRKISDESKVKEILENCGINPTSPGKLLGITEIQKKLGKEKFKELISPYIVLQESSLILVPNQDPREEVNVNQIQEEQNNED